MTPVAQVTHKLLCSYSRRGAAATFPAAFAACLCSTQLIFAHMFLILSNDTMPKHHNNNNNNTCKYVHNTPTTTRNTPQTIHTPGSTHLHLALLFVFLNVLAVCVWCVCLGCVCVLCLALGSIRRNCSDCANNPPARQQQPYSSWRQLPKMPAMPAMATKCPTGNPRCFARTSVACSRRSGIGRGRGSERQSMAAAQLMSHVAIQS